MSSFDHYTSLSNLYDPFQKHTDPIPTSRHWLIETPFDFQIILLTSISTHWAKGYCLTESNL